MKSFDHKLITVILIIISAIIFMIFGFYIMNFYKLKISADPGDWGVFGDFLGGTINPILSLATLFFVAKTYITQKNEIAKAETSASRMDELRQKSTEAQILLAQNYINQTKISTKLLKIQLMTTQINSKIQNVNIYIKEMDRVTEAINSNRKFVSVEGSEYFSNTDQDAYRLQMADKIKSTQIEIMDIQNKISTIEYTSTEL